MKHATHHTFNLSRLEVDAILTALMHAEETARDGGYVSGALATLEEADRWCALQERFSREYPYHPDQIPA